MKNELKRLAIALLLSVPLYASAQTSVNFKPTDRFFGVHFDFHANADTKGIGKTLTSQMVAEMLDKVKPDYIQVDTKGHPGISSYPTTVGVAAPDIVQDPLLIFREETAKRGIGLFSHFSGIMDARAVKDHPEWARVNSDGKPHAESTSIFGNYADDYFIPQINELSRKYHINGIWVDGECWALQPDFSAAAMDAYKNFSGKSTIPRSSNDGDWPAYKQFTRAAFRRYLTHYIDAVHKFNPKLIVTSNWSFSSFMPGKVDAPVDYLSGDFTSDAVPDVEFEARVLAPQGKPWDLMAWGFMGDKNGKGFFWKSARQLQQKAALVLAQGGGYQIYIPQNRDASLKMETVPVLAAVSKFSHDRKAYAYQTTPIPQVALLLSSDGHYNESPGIFENGQGGNNNVKGTLAMLLNSQYSVQILQEHQLDTELKKYPILVITEWRSLTPQLITMVESYVQQGGKVITIGNSHLFSKMPGTGPAKTNNLAGLPVRRQNYGKGEIACIEDNISLKYAKTGSDTLRQVVAGLVKALFPQPRVVVSGLPKVHVTINAKNQNTLIHLVNVDDHYDVNADNSLDFKMPPISVPLNISVTATKKPRVIKLQPGKISIPFTYTNGQARFKVNELDVYSIIEVINH
jgi:hypothetical protein